MIIPDTRLVTEAKAIAKAALTSTLYHHSVRSFLLAQAYADTRELSFDEEGLYVVALFHDLGLADRYRNRAQPFQLVSSALLAQFLSDHQLSTQRSRVLTEAIDFHMQVMPRWSKGVEVGLMQIGAWMDITGLRRWSIRDAARQIDARYPRGPLIVEFSKQLVRSLGSCRSCIGLLHPSGCRSSQFNQPLKSRNPS